MKENKVTEWKDRKSEGEEERKRLNIIERINRTKSEVLQNSPNAWILL